MGILNRIVRGAVSDAVSTAVGGAVNDLVKKATDGITGGSGGQAPQYAPSASAPQQASAQTQAQPPARKDKTFFAGVLQQEFPGYEIRQDVPVAELGGTGKPYDFGIYLAGQPRAVVMLTEHNRDNNAAYRNAKAAAAARGVPFLNFYLHMPNERDYVVNRVRSALV
jgi:hypothetical protein